MANVIAYTDGGCRDNQSENNIGAFAYYLECNGKKIHYSEACANTTNNRMEILAVIACLEKLMFPCNVKVHSDSAYVVNAIQKGWINGWKNNGWRRKEKNKFAELKNADLWERLYNLLQTHNVEMIKVKGHSTNKLNNFVDELLNKEMDKWEEACL